MVPGTGTIVLFKGKKKIDSWKLKKKEFGTAKKASVTWNGRVNGNIKPGTYKVVVTFKSSEDGKSVRTTKNLSVSAKKGILTTKKGLWTTAYSSLKDCQGDRDPGSCFYYPDGSLDYDSFTWMQAEHSLPYPVSKSKVHSWRLRIDGKSSDPSEFALFLCGDPACKSYGSQQNLTGNYNTRYTWTSTWTKLGILDGTADWAIDCEAPELLTVYRYQVEVKYWKLE